MIKFLLCMFLFTGGLVFASTGNAESPAPLKVFILAGQSNMGNYRNNATQLTPELRKPQTDVLMFVPSGNSWNPYLPPPTSIGPEIKFGHEMAKLMGEPVGIVKHAVPGTSMAMWSPLRNGQLYGELAELVKRAQKSRQIEIVGMIWMQGEADAKDSGLARDYAANIESLIVTARRDFVSPKMVFVAGRVNPAPVTTFPYVLTVRRAIEGVADTRYSYIDCDNLEKVAEADDLPGISMHYSMRGTMELGLHFAQETWNVMQGKPASVPAATLPLRR